MSCCHGGVRSATRRDVPGMMMLPMRRDAGPTSRRRDGSAACFVNLEAGSSVAHRPGTSSGAPPVERSLHSCVDEAIPEMRRYGDRRACAMKQPCMRALEGAPLRWLGRRLHDKANGNSVFPMFCRSIRLVPVDSWSFDQVNRMHRCRDAEHHLVRRIPRAGACASPPRASAALHEGRTPGSDWHTACFIVI